MYALQNDDFPDLIGTKLEHISPNNFQSLSKEDVGLIQTNSLSSWNDFSVIRHVNCELLIGQQVQRCQSCTGYRKTLHAMRSRTEEMSKAASDEAKINDRYLPKFKLLEKVKSLERDKNLLTSRNIRLISRVKKLVKMEGVKLDSSTNDLIRTIQKNHVCPFDIDSPQELLL